MFPATERRWRVARRWLQRRELVCRHTRLNSALAPDPVARGRTPDGVSDGLPTTPPGRRPGGAGRRAGRPDASPTPPDAAPRTEPDGGRTGSRPVPDKLPARRTERRLGGHQQKSRAKRVFRSIGRSSQNQQHILLPSHISKLPTTLQLQVPGMMALPSRRRRGMHTHWHMREGRVGRRASLARTALLHTIALRVVSRRRGEERVDESLEPR